MRWWGGDSVRRRGDCFQSMEDRSDSCLAGRVGEEVAGQRIDEERRREKFIDVNLEVVAQRRALGANFVDDGESAVDYEDQIFQVMTCEKVAITAIEESFDLGREEVSRFEKPRIFWSNGITSRIKGGLIHLHKGAPRRVSSENPNARRRSPKAVYSA